MALSRAAGDHREGDLAQRRSLGAYFLIEARTFALRGPLLGLAVGAAMIAITHLAIPRLPDTAIIVLERSFAVQGRAALLLLNDHLAMYAALFFGGLAELLRALVAPREERQLELLLAKPVPARTFVIARVAPVLAAVWLAGAVLGAGTAIAIAPVSTPASATSAGALGGAIVVGSASVLLLAALAPVLARSRDGFEALVVSFVAWVVPLLPATAFLYRPDLFEGRPALTTAIVAPANLIWLDAAMPGLSVVATAIAAAGSALFLVLAGRLLARGGVR